MNETDLPPYEPARVLAASFPERVEMACRTWAAQLTPNQPSIMALYWAKYFLLFIGGWVFWVSFNGGYPGLTSPLDWAFTADAFRKAIAWSIFYELMGFGCGWGPMNARFKPMMGGVRHWLRPRTIKLPLFPGVPVIGSTQRGWLDVGLYAANQLFLLRALLAPEVTPDLLVPSLVLIPLLGVLDKTLFLAARAEHYYIALVCLVWAWGDDLWVAACKVLWGCIWFWAATSKLNHHFPSVIMFMMNNGPFFPKILKKRLFQSYPEDLHPSMLAATMANFGTLAEYTIPFVLLTSTSETVTLLGLILMTGFHGFIALNNPNGMPIEWNILMIFGGWFLFGFHPDPGPLAIAQLPGLTALVVFSGILVPLYGNFVPSRVSFLLSMRYYAGNWAYNVWLIRKDATHKLDQLVKAGGTVRQQLAEILPDEQAVDVAMTMMLASRFMHLQGRPLLEALPRTVDDIDAYDWHEGEVLGGTILGWNFGDGHLNGKYLLEAVQQQCGFEDGELRVLSVESQPLFGRGWHWEIHDAARGLLDEGDTELAPMRAVTPWPTGAYAEALVRRPAQPG